VPPVLAVPVVPPLEHDAELKPGLPAAGENKGNALAHAAELHELQELTGVLPTLVPGKQP